MAQAYDDFIKETIQEFGDNRSPSFYLKKGISQGENLIFAVLEQNLCGFICRATGERVSKINYIGEVYLNLYEEHKKEIQQLFLSDLETFFKDDLKKDISQELKQFEDLYFNK